MHTAAKVAIALLIVYFVAVEACAPKKGGGGKSSNSSGNSSGNGTGRRRRSADAVQVFCPFSANLAQIVLTTLENYNEANKNAVLQIVRNDLESFALSKGLPPPTKHVLTEAVNRSGKFATKFTVVGGDCPKAQAFVKDAVASLAGISSAVVTCADGSVAVFNK